MSEPFLGEVRLFGFGFAPRGWATCDGQILPINENQALYALLGTTYGGDGRTNFALPDLRGRTSVAGGRGAGAPPIGTAAGSERHALTAAEMPQHTHAVSGATTNATSSSPAGNVLTRAGQQHYRNTPDALVPMRRGTVGVTGAGAGHENMQPFTTVNFCIALQGLFPSRN